jgi:hypothetical protein
MRITKNAPEKGFSIRQALFVPLCEIDAMDEVFFWAHVKPLSPLGGVRERTRTRTRAAWAASALSISVSAIFRP